MKQKQSTIVGLLVAILIILIIFLIVGIFISVYIIRLIKSAQNIVDNVNELVDISDGIDKKRLCNTFLGKWLPFCN